MYIDSVNGLTHLTAHGGHVLVNGGKIVKEIWLTQGESARDWQEVSDLVLLTPQEQQQRVDELEQTNAELVSQKEELVSQKEELVEENRVLKADWEDITKLTAQVTKLKKFKVDDELPIVDNNEPIADEMPVVKDNVMSGTIGGSTI